jgi:hypothetical protein
MCDRSHLATMVSEQTLDALARGAARQAGLVARKSRWRANTVDNHGGFRVVDLHNNLIVAGERYDLSANDVIEFCGGNWRATLPSA